MNWRVVFSPDALKFLERNNLDEWVVVEKISDAIRLFNGERVNINIRKLGGEWEGFYSIRKGKIRIIAEFRFNSFTAHIEKVDWRGNVYK